MNNKSNKSFFNKRNLITIGISLVILFLIILFFIPKYDEELKEEQLTINCSFTKQLPLMDVNIKMEVDYVNEEFKYVKEEYVFK